MRLSLTASLWSRDTTERRLKVVKCPRQERDLDQTYRILGHRPHSAGFLAWPAEPAWQLPKTSVSSPAITVGGSKLHT